MPPRGGPIGDLGALQEEVERSSKAARRTSKWSSGFRWPWHFLGFSGGEMAVDLHDLTQRLFRGPDVIS
jgi:hypothetical protein